MRIVRMGMRIAVVSTLLALLLPYIPATAAPSPSPAFCDVDGHILPGAGIGKLMLNQPVEDARRLLDAGGAPPKTDNSWVTYTSGPNDGVGYVARGGVIQGIAISISSTAPLLQRGCRTPNGLGLLSPEQDVLALYGSMPRVYRLTRPPHSDLHSLVFAYDDQGVAFGIETSRSDSRVVSVQVFTPGTYCTTFPEACSP